MTGCLATGSCSSAGTGFGVSPASASCAAGVEYQGHFYVAWTDKLPVARGKLLGEGVYPPCNDTGGCDEGDPDNAGRPTRVWEMRGATPDQVVVARLEGTD